MPWFKPDRWLWEVEEKDVETADEEEWTENVEKVELQTNPK